LKEKLEHLELMLQKVLNDSPLVSLMLNTVQFRPGISSEEADSQSENNSKYVEIGHSSSSGRTEESLFSLLGASWPLDVSPSSDVDDYPSEDQEAIVIRKISDLADDREPNPATPRVFFDNNRRGSNMQDVRDAIKLKDSLMGRLPRPISAVMHDITSRRPEYWSPPPVCISAFSPRLV
jgi:hypothetical protein